MTEQEKTRIKLMEYGTDDVISTEAAAAAKGDALFLISKSLGADTTELSDNYALAAIAVALINLEETLKKIQTRNPY